MICPKCQTENLEGAKFCAKCGQSLFSGGKQIFKNQTVRFFLFILGLPLACILIAILVGSRLETSGPGRLTASIFFSVWLLGQLLMWLKPGWLKSKKLLATILSILTIPIIVFGLFTLGLFISFIMLILNIIACMFNLPWFASCSF